VEGGGGGGRSGWKSKRGTKEIRPPPLVVVGPLSCTSPMQGVGCNAGMWWVFEGRER